MKGSTTSGAPDLVTTTATDQTSEADKAAADKAEADRQAAEQAAADRAAADRAAAEQAEADRLAAEQDAADKAAADKAARDQAKASRLAADKAAAENAVVHLYLTTSTLSVEPHGRLRRDRIIRAPRRLTFGLIASGKARRATETEVASTPWPIVDFA